MKLTICVPTVTRPHEKTLESIAASVPLLNEAGHEHTMVSEVGNPYISQARNVMLRKALDWGAEVIVFIDHDVSWSPDALRKLVEADADCVGGLYRFAIPRDDSRRDHAYMGTVFTDLDNRPVVREDGLVSAELLPAGFLKVTRQGVNKFMEAYPELLYGERCKPHVDLFNHGAIDWMWYGEDYAMSKRYRERVGPIWALPDLDLTHWRGNTPYHGNFHEFMLRQPGGVKSTYIPPSQDHD